MKKSIILMAALIGLALTACDEEKDLGVMQKNERPVVVPVSGVAVQSKFNTTGESINLGNYKNANIAMIDAEVSTVFPEGSTVTGEVQISDNPEFNKPQTISLSSVEATSANSNAKEAAGGNTISLTGVVNGNNWEDAFVALYGYNPAERVNYVRYKLWLVHGDQKSILPYEGEEWWPSITFNVTPVDVEFDVAPSYTLLYQVGNGEVQQLVMKHDDSQHVYDNPVFSGAVAVSEEAAEEGFYWTIAPTDDLNKVFGVTGEADEMEGDLDLISAGAVKGQITEFGTFKIDANMLDKTYSVMLAPPSLYVVMRSANIEWNGPQLGTTDYIHYSGMVGVLGNWGLAGQDNYKGIVYINDGNVDKETAQNGTVTGGLAYSPGTTITKDNSVPVSFNNLYYITANITSLQYTMYRCQTMGFVGTYNEWGTTDTQTLKGSRTTNYLEWTGTLEVNAGDEFKIRCNNDWVVNFGGANGSSFATDGSPVEITMDGANFVAEESGKYTVTVYLKRTLQADGTMSPYYMTVTPAN